ncbi:MAG: methyl-accepting chemotaxis protein [Chloroflexi bacterium]|nr:methyl-accepting chemotaxis protein [Chloroflexota bacterium]
MFVAVADPVTDNQGQVIAVLVGYVNLTTLDKIMTGFLAPSETFEVYLINSDHILLTESHFDGYSKGDTLVHTEGMDAAITLTNGSGFYEGYRGETVAGAYRWLPALQVALVVEREQAEATGEVMGTMIITTSMMLLGLLIAGITSLFIARSIARPLTELTQTAIQIAEGDVEHVAKMDRADEIGVLARALNDMTSRLRGMLRDEQEQRERLRATVQAYSSYMTRVTQGDLTTRLDLSKDEHNVADPLTLLGRNLNETTTSLQHMIRQMHETASDLSSASTEILAATTQQASGASEQSAAITQTTTTVDELKTIAEQSVMRAQEVTGASHRTVEVSRDGRQAMEDTIGSMGQIKVRVEEIAENILSLSEQTQQIGEIITTVNDIAAQSNILALNASVEAARAGEYGKGFSVVAVEVRNLAEQSRQATTQVRAILSDIQHATNATVMATEEGTKGVDEGMQLAVQAGHSIEQLAGVIEEAAQSATQMVAGGRQQAAGVDQVAVAMQSINQATVQSLASTRQAEKAARDLNDLSRSLTEIVEQYRF